MPIGTSDGEFFEDNFEYLKSRPVINPDVDPRFMTRDQNVVTPEQMWINQQMDKAEQDPTTGTGIPIGLKRVEITGGTIDSRMPLEGPTEPAGEFKSAEGRQTPENVDWTKMNQPFGTLKSTSKEDTPVIYKGKNITITEGDIEQAINVGMGAGPGIMMGVKAKSFSKVALQQAQQMEAEGVHPDEIWSKTGVFKGADSRWRQEIDDSKATVNPKAFKTITAEHIGPGGKKITQEFNPSLGDILDHPELYKAYPDLRHIEVIPFKEGEQYGRAAYNASNDTIELGKNFAIEDVLHEVQHAIQKREGFAKGGSPAQNFALRFEEELRIAKIEANQLLQYRQSDKFKGWSKEDEGRIQELKRLFEIDTLRKSLAFKEAESQYMRLAGEVESRNVEIRGILNQNARRAIPPILTEDTSRSMQLVIDEPMWTTPYGPTLTPMKAPD